MSSYQKAVEELKKMDEEYGDVWKMPSFENSLLFAMTEIGETVDAYMRTMPEFFRNRDFQTNGNELYEEATDVVMMMIKALMVAHYDFGKSWIMGEAKIVYKTVMDSVLYAGYTITEILIDHSSQNIWYSDLDYNIQGIISNVEKQMGAGYVGNRIAEKMNKTRAKILARQEEKKNV